MFIVEKYKIHLHLQRNRPEMLTKDSLIDLFIKLLQINYIFFDNVCILSMY